MIYLVLIDSIKGSKDPKDALIDLVTGECGSSTKCPIIQQRTDTQRRNAAIPEYDITASRTEKSGKEGHYTILGPCTP